MPESVSSRLQVDFPAVQTRLNAEEEAVVMETIRNSPTWSQGEQQRAFEQEFTRYVGCADSLAVSSCTSALEMAAALCGLTPEDEVILPAHTFVSSAVPFARTGARLVFADIDPATRLLSAEHVEPCLTEADQGDRGGPPLRFARRHGPDSPPGPGAWPQGGGRRGPGPGRGLQGAQDGVHGGLCRLQLPQPEEHLHPGRGGHADCQRSGGRRAGQEAPLDGQLALCRRPGALLEAGHGKPGERHEGSLALQFLSQRGAVRRGAAVAPASGCDQCPQAGPGRPSVRTPWPMFPSFPFRRCRRATCTPTTCWWPASTAPEGGGRGTT